MSNETNFDPTWHVRVGLNHVGAYQVSGRPFAKAVGDTQTGSDPIQVEFPYVTRWVQIINNDTDNAVKVAFSVRGLATESNYFRIGKASAASLPTASERLELKVSSLYFTGSTDVDIVAGLTSIEPTKVKTSDGENWSGSAGVG